MKRLSKSPDNIPIQDIGLAQNAGDSPPVEARCPVCGASVCEHGVCDDFCSTDGEECPECFERRCQEEEARLEASWQENVMGPILGFDRPEEPESVTARPDFEKHEEKKP